jgi:hypothetical protein
LLASPRAPGDDRGMKRGLRLSDRSRETPRARALYFVMRCFVYGILGVALEVMFYSLVRAGRQVPILEYLFQFDWRVDAKLHLDGPWESPLHTLFGQSSLWMMLVYAMPAMTIEWLYRTFMFKRPWYLRAPVYGLTILFFEWWTGLALIRITGYAIWEYRDAGNITHATSWFILPMWMGAGMLIEIIYRELMDPKLRAALEAKL